MEPRTPETNLGGIDGKIIITCIIGFFAAMGFELLAESGFTLIDWEASWAESTTAFVVGIIVAAVIAIIALMIMRNNRDKKLESN